jgi:hypothetical protein
MYSNSSDAMCLRFEGHVVTHTVEGKPTLRPVASLLWVFVRLRNFYHAMLELLSTFRLCRACVRAESNNLALARTRKMKIQPGGCTLSSTPYPWISSGRKKKLVSYISNAMVCLSSPPHTTRSLIDVMRFNVFPQRRKKKPKIFVVAKGRIFRKDFGRMGGSS